MMPVAITPAELTALGGVLVSGAGVVVAIWKYANYLTNKRAADKDKRQDSIIDANEHLRLELYEQNKLLRAENQAQYDAARKLALERDQLEDELRRQYRYIDWLQMEMNRVCPAAIPALPEPPTRLLLNEKDDHPLTPNR